MNDKYWIEFWKTYGASANDKDEHTQVLRTLNKKPISKDLWEFTLQKLDDVFFVKKNDRVLDLCSGNGLFSKHFVAKGASVVAVDISQDLLVKLDGIEEIQTINSDIRDLDFENNSFDKIIIYAGIQYLRNKETVQLLQVAYKWLKPGGVFFIGDIPDISKLWEFYNTKERQKIYFENLLSDASIVGNWYDSKWFEKLTRFIGFKECKTIVQDSKLIYSNFRFDFLCKKEND
ncbi:class I SAM-dependent methyltransferase [Flavobacteriaceae bacterium XHP0103]|uniref:class I SAM-dependent methyltransferase n=1 Tax=Marixanthotalea marina TaxID=2844359 RepID=UPI002989F22D|nr:class I SAM-dependent methyltransferase [Marixanthotalea marina]MBU3822749.1 class I SAM-dependent methyltransferase [Marixanthotalea marina]